MKRIFLFTLLFFLFVCSNAFSNEGPVFTPTPRPNIQSAIKSSKFVSVQVSITNLEIEINYGSSLGWTTQTLTDKSGSFIYQEL